jgi:hypothetical protein
MALAGAWAVTSFRRWAGAGILVGLLAAASGVAAGPATVRYPEGYLRGFLVLRSTQGGHLADGELVQVPHGTRVETRLTFRFKDGSLHEEVTVFAQSSVFTLLRYRLVQRGPAFSHATEASLERETNRYAVRVREQSGGKESGDEGYLELPADAYNGMALILAKNLPNAGTVTGAYVAFTPKPRLVKMTVTANGEDSFVVGETTRKAARCAVSFEIGGLTGLIAPLVGKKPPVLHYWVVTGPAPLFVKFEGPLDLGGPVRRVELATPRWPSSGRPKKSP